MASSRMRWSKPEVIGKTPTLKNHTAVLVNNELFVFGGYDGRRNHAAVHILDCTTFEWRSCSTITGIPPAGRNGHTATLADRKIFIIGGWLGSGPYAASDCHYLDTDAMHWTEPPVVGKAPGPCNMHTADYLERRRQILVFRGGNGREYLNDLHGLNIDTCQWEEVRCEGSAPPPRANHASAVVDNKLFIFGGWNGERRLNDIHFLDAETMMWSTPEVSGPLPHPRAGMTFTSMRGRLLLFGGSGTSAKCFNDLQIFDPQTMAWLETGSSSYTLASGMAGADADSTHRQGKGQVQAVADSYATSGHPNPNDEHAGAGRVMVVGDQPSHRAGHTATVVNQNLVVIGGSYGSEYLGDLYLLDTDPVPEPTANSASSHMLLCEGLRYRLNCAEFSDVTFVVEGQPIYAHKVILALISDRFRAMFSSGFQEANQREIVVRDWSHAVFLLMMEYLYTGKEPPGISNPSLTVELLELADQYMLDHLKEMCEARLQEAVSEETVDYFGELAERTNAMQLAAVCRHFVRNHTHMASSLSSPSAASLAARGRPPR